MLSAKSWPDTQLPDTCGLHVHRGSFGSFSYSDWHLLMWQSDGTDQDWALRVGWHILASTLTMPGKLLTQKPFNCPHTTPGTLALFNQRFLFLKWFHLSEVRHISAFLTGACAQMLLKWEQGGGWWLGRGGVVPGLAMVMCMFRAPQFLVPARVVLLEAFHASSTTQAAALLHFP